MTTTALAQVERQNADSQPINTSTATLILEDAHLARLVALAEIMAKGVATIPRHLQKNVGDCLAVAMQATQWRMNPFAVAQKTHVVNGTLGYEAQLVNAVVTTMAPTKDRINYEWFGDWSKVMGKFEERTSKKKTDEDTGQPQKYRVPAWTLADEAGLGVRVWATMKGEAEPRVLELLLVQSRTRNSPLWADDPRQQLAYLAVKRWTRLHCPDVLLGVYTPDELDEAPTPKDMGAAEVVQGAAAGAKALTPEQLDAWRVEAGKGRKAARQHWQALPADIRALASEAVKQQMWKIAEDADAARTVDNGAATTQAAPAPAAAQATAAAPAPGTEDPWLADMAAAEAGTNA